MAVEPSNSPLSARKKVSARALYGEPLAVVLACVSLALVFAVNSRPAATNAADFYVFWDSGHWFREGTDMYLGHPVRPFAGYNLNAPAVVLLFLPFTMLPLVPAFLLWTVLAIIAFCVAAVWIARAVAPGQVVLVVCAIFISQTTFSSLQLGQLTWMGTLLITAAWLADRGGRQWAAGVLLGISIAAKPFLGLFLLYVLWRRSRPLLVGLLIGAIGFYMVGLLIGGVSAYRSWLTVLAQVTWASHSANGSLFGMFTRLLDAPQEGAKLAAPLLLRPGLVRPLWAVASCLVIAAAAWRIAVDRQVDRAWLILLLASLLVSPLGWNYYAPIMAGPLFVRFHQGGRATQRLVVCGYLCFCVPYTVVSLGGAGLVTATLGSIYGWGFLLWLAAALV